MCASSNEGQLQLRFEVCGFNHVINCIADGKSARFQPSTANVQRCPPHSWLLRAVPVCDLLNWICICSAHSLTETCIPEKPVECPWYLSVAIFDEGVSGDHPIHKFPHMLHIIAASNWPKIIERSDPYNNNLQNGFFFCFFIVPLPVSASVSCFYVTLKGRPCRLAGNACHCMHLAFVGNCCHTIIFIIHYYQHHYIIIIILIILAFTITTIITLVIIIISITIIIIICYLLLLLPLSLHCCHAG